MESSFVCKLPKSLDGLKQLPHNLKRLLAVKTYLQNACSLFILFDMSLVEFSKLYSELFKCVCVCVCV